MLAWCILKLIVIDIYCVEKLHLKIKCSYHCGCAFYSTEECPPVCTAAFCSKNNRAKCTMYVGRHYYTKIKRCISLICSKLFSTHSRIDFCLCSSVGQVLVKFQGAPVPASLHFAQLVTFLRSLFPCLVLVKHVVARYPVCSVINDGLSVYIRHMQ